MGPDQPEQDLGICLMDVVSLRSRDPHLQPMIPDGNATIGVTVHITRTQRPFPNVGILPEAPCGAS
jgi:hypothetical protein